MKRRFDPWFLSGATIFTVGLWAIHWGLPLVVMGAALLKVSYDEFLATRK